MGDELFDDLMDLERAGWDALCTGDGATFYADLMTEDGFMVLAHGQALDRPGVTASLRGAAPWSDYRIDDPHLVTTGADSAALVYRATARRPGAEDFTARMTSVYVRVTGRWRLALYTQTTVPS
ncbi:MAG: nuclear transport factor 2 family protein [Nocardioides sp.]